METRKFIKVSDMIISNKFHETLKDSKDPFYEYFCRSVENMFPNEFEVLSETIRSDFNNIGGNNLLWD